jgi:8-oxo-dGTP pyrophosphatase MutT (NUDIX family)
MSWEPHVTVAVVVENAGKYLLVEELADGTSPVINQPAGHVEQGETLIAAALRETVEETAWQVDITSFLGIYVYTPPLKPECTYYRHCFLAKPVKEMPNKTLDVGIIQALWLSYDDILMAEKKGKLRSPLVKKCIDDARAGHHFPLNIIYEHSPS